MDVERFQDSPAGVLVPIDFHDPRTGRKVSHFAFSPHPLPAEPDIRRSTYKAMAEAERELGRLDAQVRALPNPHLLVRPALSREAVATSALEGTFAPLSDVLAGDNIDDRRKSAEVREVQNYQQAALNGLELIRRKPICFSVAAELQARLVRGTRGDSFDSGRMRERIVAIGDRGGSIEKARFVPVPDGDLLEQGVSDWERWVNADDDIPFIARLALSHYQFETLHPFSDGNGRIGRLLIALQLVDAEVLHHPVLNVSSWLEPRRQEYIDHILDVSATGEYDPWIAFFAEGIRHEAITASRRVERLGQVQERVVQQVLEAGKKGVIVELARDLIGSPILSVADVKKEYSISQPSARQVVLNLVDLGVLRPATSSTWGRLYMCDPVYDAIVLDE